MADKSKPSKRYDPDAALLGVISKAADTPTYRPLLDYLAERRAVPEIKQAYTGESTSGMFQTNIWSNGPMPAEGRVTISHGAGPNTLIHEITHAAQRQLAKQAFEEEKLRRGFFPPPMTQFHEAYTKLQEASYVGARGAERNPAVAFAKRLAPEFVKKGEDYRTTPEELQAFAVGDASDPSGAYERAPLHVSPTLATEFMILLDLATRQQKETNASKPPPKTR